jgi:hypothetical protein
VTSRDERVVGDVIVARNLNLEVQASLCAVCPKCGKRLHLPRLAALTLRGWSVQRAVTAVKDPRLKESSETGWHLTAANLCESPRYEGKTLLYQSTIDLTFPL